MQVTFSFPNGTQHGFEVAIPPVQDCSVFLVGIKKGGSTLMAKITRELAPHSQKVLFEYPRLCFAEGLPASLAVADCDHIFQKPGYIFGVFRWLPENDLLILNRKLNEGRDRFLLLLRDPRDVLVSLYYSDAKSHAVPGKGPMKEKFESTRELLKSVSIDDYVLQQAPTYLRHFYRTLQVEALPGSTVLRYEDIVYDKPLLVSTLAELMDAEVTPEQVAAIAGKHDKIPKAENQNSHIRQVHPGNYLKKLKPETIESLNDTFAVILDKLGYQRTAAAAAAT